MSSTSQDSLAENGQEIQQVSTFAWMTANSPVAVYALDKNGFIISWSEAAQRIFGWSAEELIGHAGLQLIPAGEIEETYQITREILNGKIINGKLVKRQTKSGDILTVIIWAYPHINAAGEVLGSTIFAAEDFRSTELFVHRDRIRMYEALTQALQRNEFELYYQPKVDTETGRLLGAEALLRWFNPELGQVSPEHFIPFAEQSGLIWEIGAWVLRRACACAKSWQMAGLPSIRIAVNVSVVQFEHDGFLQLVEEVLEETQLDPQWLELEITESVFANHLERVISVVNRLTELGVSIAVDDFGTGYSALRYLPFMALSTLKIDQAFVRILQETDRAKLVVANMIELAHSLNMRVVAEGVEHPGQWAVLKANRCDEIQGYLVLPPQPQDLFEQICLKRPEGEALYAFEFTNQHLREIGEPIAVQRR
ncbi:sensor domain-containing protein [Alicyclobacillus acidiphilus]|uniref:sensor domain-containing protein n=1 Tax=Alicyclobacillus acidiphilus TaxID=182455 RepID=UPI00083248A3|nr:EAL domain-containing protein [Alicyclobacillus acidiphilus]